MTNRTICDILSDLRRCNETRNYSYFLSLIEEIQWAANRMEAALSDQSDLQSLKEKRAKIKDKLNDVQQALRKVKTDLGKQAPKSIDSVLKINIRY